MSDGKTSPGGYVNRVLKNTNTYILELLEENEKLRQRNIGLDSESLRFKEKAAALESELSSLQQKREEVEALRAGLEEKLAEAEEETHRFSSRFVEVEEQNNNLANLYVASYQLHQTVNHDEVLTVLQEIIINLIGSEDFVIFERSTTTGELVETVSFGIESSRLETLDLRSGPIAETARTGELYVVENLEPGDSDLVACVPMKLGDRIHGVIAIFALLSHKDGLEPLDHELFDLLASHAASSLYVSRLHEETQKGSAG